MIDINMVDYLIRAAEQGDQQAIQRQNHNRFVRFAKYRAARVVMKEEVKEGLACIQWH